MNIFKNPSNPEEEIDMLIRKIWSLEVGYPLIEMEKLVKIGYPAVEPILRILSQADGVLEFDPLPFLVILGEIGSPEAIDVLIKFMLDVENDVLANVACESIAKVHKHKLVIDALQRIIKEGNKSQRILAYGALGYMKIPEAHQILLPQLKNDLELVDVIALCLSEYYEKDDIEKIYEVYKNLPDNTFNLDIEESIYTISHPENREKSPVEKNWRTRYRRLASYGDMPELSVLSIAFIVHKNFEKNKFLREKKRTFPKRPLNEILQDERLKINKEKYCEYCGDKITYPTGLPVCSEIKYGVIFKQEEFLKSLINSGIKTIPEAFDFTNEEERKIRKRWLGKKRKLEETVIKILTLNFFAERKIYLLEDAVKELERIRKELDEIPEMPSRRATEKITWNLARILKEKNFKSPKDANKFLKKLTAQRDMILPPVPRNELEIAQDIVYEAWDIKNKNERIRLAKKALSISKNCADAYVLLAEEQARSLNEAKEYYSKGVEAGERALGKEMFEESKGDFWGAIETRPYMRARAGLAQCLWKLGEYEEAIAHYKEMLLLNPHDNQGIRYLLASSFAELERYEELEKLLNSEYKGDCSPYWCYTAALLTFMKKDIPKANRELQIAIKYNPSVPEYLTGKKSIPKTFPELLTVGGENEAFVYASDFLKLWQRTPGAIEWLKEQTMEN
ncbi:hypothetical protein COY51_05460 [Candidatus Desantisbacteria bacterium CG_4_10_14_0_8_um_filter_39_17]|uniref:Uncharacterized protein n=1 Tax=Candidatus Desantisbacteria bacterium CG_4_10_14_0_8_um_filter_39_17 TaxID=1974542 RepID=A0A2H9PAC3_9BACT|nr:MAG: hypothetical protein COY51_05460 [Candidatus Desantisbacteria bacterium CG_4_10_14_0_8_um_filter_39_17]